MTMLIKTTPAHSEILTPLIGYYNTFDKIIVQYLGLFISVEDRVSEPKE